MVGTQQPEVDAHAICAEIYDWYTAIGGRVGWDNGEFDTVSVPNQAIRLIVHGFDDIKNSTISANARFDGAPVRGKWISYIIFFDGDPTDINRRGAFHSFARSRALMAHEYQHAVTEFSFKDGHGNPGLSHAHWHEAIHEGVSDVFGGLFSGEWLMGQEISPRQEVLRNLAFPRDRDAASKISFDHYGDRNAEHGENSKSYACGTILAHAAFLMAEGGVHQRTDRNPALIPVKGLGRELRNGIDVYKAALIWYSTLTDFLSNIGAVTGTIRGDERVFLRIRDACVSAAAQLFGKNSCECRTVMLVFYAVGLHPVGTVYGPDLTFLTAGSDWLLSQPYIGIKAPKNASPDLFIRNGRVSNWSAKISRRRRGAATQIENKVYCRVRNIGDQAATNIKITFEYAKVVDGVAQWFPMKDKNGIVQSLRLTRLPAGQLISGRQANYAAGQCDGQMVCAAVSSWRNRRSLQYPRNRLLYQGRELF